MFHGVPEQIFVTAYGIQNESSRPRLLFCEYNGAEHT